MRHYQLTPEPSRLMIAWAKLLDGIAMLCLLCAGIVRWPASFMAAGLALIGATPVAKIVLALTFYPTQPLAWVGNRILEYTDEIYGLAPRRSK